MDKLRAMKNFVTVVRAGSLSAAARELGTPLTNISRSLSQLEMELGCTLVTRTTRKMVLTPEGRDYFAVCQLLLDDLEQAEQQLLGNTAELSGMLTLTAPRAFGKLHVLPVLNSFLAAYPKIDARLLLEDRHVDMLDEGVDIAVRIGVLRDSGHLATLIGHLHMVVCAAPRYLETHGTPQVPTDIVEHASIGFTSPPSGLRWSFKSTARGRTTVRLRPRLIVNTAEAAVEAAESGLGIARVLSYQAQEAIQAGRLVPILTAWDDTQIPVHLLRWPSRATPLRVHEFLGYATQALRERAW